MANSHNAYSRYLLTAGFIIIILEEKKKTKIILFSSAARNMRREDVPVWPKNFRKFNLFTFVANATIFCTHLKCHQTKAHNLMFWTMFRTDFCVQRKKKKHYTRSMSAALVSISRSSSLQVFCFKLRCTRQKNIHAISQSFTVLSHSERYISNGTIENKFYGENNQSELTRCIIVTMKFEEYEEQEEGVITNRL